MEFSSDLHILHSQVPVYSAQIENLIKYQSAH